VSNTSNLVESLSSDLAGLEHRDDLGQDSNIGSSLNDIVGLFRVLRKTRSESIVAEGRVSSLGGSRDVGVVLVGGSKVPVAGIETNTVNEKLDIAISRITARGRAVGTRNRVCTVTFFLADSVKVSVKLPIVAGS